MNEQKLIKKIQEQAASFKLRTEKNLSDEKRHDIVQSDEQKSMWTAHNQLGWSFATIGSVFDRDRRTAQAAIERYVDTKKKKQKTETGDIFQELSAVDGGTEVLLQYGLKLAGAGVFEYDIPIETRPVFQELSILGLVRLEQRTMSNAPGRIYVLGYWELTPQGKAILRLLKKQKKSVSPDK